jgi:hypothetical protein
MTPIELFFFGLALLFGLLVAGRVQDGRWVRGEEKRIAERALLERRSRRTRDEHAAFCREFGLPFYVRHDRLGHVVVVPCPFGTGEDWFLCTSFDSAMRLLSDA